MKVQIHSPQLTIDTVLKEHSISRANHLKHYDDTITSTDIYFLLDNKRHNIKDKTVELKCHVPHKEYFVSHTSKTFEEAFEHAYHSLVSKMSKRK